MAKQKISRCRQQRELLREQLVQRIRDLEQAEREIAKVIKSYPYAARGLNGGRVEVQRRLRRLRLQRYLANSHSRPKIA